MEYYNAWKTSKLLIRIFYLTLRGTYLVSDLITFHKISLFDYIAHNPEGMKFKSYFHNQGKGTVSAIAPLLKIQIYYS